MIHNRCPLCLPQGRATRMLLSGRQSRWLVAPLKCALLHRVSQQMGEPLWLAVPQQQHCLTTAWRSLGACQVGLVPDSGLDASSQYPSLGSFTTPVARLMVETRGVPQGFLSYYHVMPSSRPSQLWRSAALLLAVGSLIPSTTTASPLVCSPWAAMVALSCCVWGFALGDNTVGLQHQSGALSVAGG